MAQVSCTALCDLIDSKRLYSELSFRFPSESEAPTPKYKDFAVTYYEEDEQEENESTNDGEPIRLFTYTTIYENLGDVGADIYIDKSIISMRNIKFGDSTSLNVPVNIDFDPSKRLKVLLDPDTFQIWPSTLELDEEGFITAHYYININASIVNLPSQIELNQKSTCQVFQVPNVDLLHDWVFCHNHGPCSSGGEPFQIPTDLKPVILDRLEQVIYLLVSNEEEETAKILLESYDEKDDSIYLEWHKCTFASSHSINVQSKESLKELIFTYEGAEDEELNGNIDLSITPKCIVKHRIFGKCRDENDNPSRANQAHYSRDKKLLTKYRMAFDIEWYRVEAHLFHSLASLLIESSECLARLEENILDHFRDFLEPDSDDATLRLAQLDRYVFV